MGNPFWNSYQEGRLKFGAAALAAATPSGAMLYLLYELLGLRDAWIWYLSGALFYTLLVFGYAYIDDNSTLFSDKDSRSKSKLAIVHLGYLVFLYFIAQAAEYFHPRLPLSMFSEGRKGSSWFEIVVFAAVGGVFFVEESWLKAEEKEARSGGE
jgi:hypothetical protein